MGPINDRSLVSRNGTGNKALMSSSDQIVEAWGQGFNIGALIILILLVFCNYRAGVLLHKLILLELVLALLHGYFIFFNDPVYGWFLSTTAVLLIISYQLHNVVAWIKIKPFLPPWGGKFYIYTLIVVQPFWVVELYFNFIYFNRTGDSTFRDIRAWEALARDPWWIFTTCRLVFIIKRDYFWRLKELIRTSPRFGVLIFCMCLSIGFLVVDVVVTAAGKTGRIGINPYWRLALVFKCASDTIFLDDFKSVLDCIKVKAFGRAGDFVHRGGPVLRRSPSDVDISTRKADSLDHGAAVTIHSEHPLRDAPRKWAQKLFTRQPENAHIERSTTITLSNLDPSENRNGNFGSSDRSLPKPETAATMGPYFPAS
ncbi:hypothetical protein MMC07_004605 [Pseudocyphellaria aurata]|nr:hypothetical protein [Pseudocyphellaria aurata]